jgi:hypothetical protein
MTRGLLEELIELITPKFDEVSVVPGFPRLAWLNAL